MEQTRVTWYGSRGAGHVVRVTGSTSGMEWGGVGWGDVGWAELGGWSGRLLWLGWGGVG